jgi:CelD/BcsL family acetyltransferase involved in cellulose biosynthesis
MFSIVLSRPVDLASIGERWLGLQACAGGSFFQSWTWTGCLAEERFPDPVLLEAQENGAVVALGLFNRRRSWPRPDRLWLGESGSAQLDTMFIEHNGLLLARRHEDRLEACLQSALRAPLRPGRHIVRRRLILNGVDAQHLAAARRQGSVRIRQTRPSPFVDLAALRARGEAYLDSLSANTRYQLRRSARCYAAAGPLGVTRARTVAEAQAFLDAMAALHQATWQRRGQPGAFAEASFRRFHRRLIERAMPNREVDLLRIAAGDAVIGYLYNFRFRGRVASYQSGFDYDAAGAHQKPGLTCHHLAIEMYRSEGMDSYDFLAGESRYKASLSHACTPLYWLELAARGTRPEQGQGSALDPPGAEPLDLILR